jgi:hypothetical protein
MAKKDSAEQQQAARVKRASLKERIEFLDTKPDRTQADVKLANQLAREHNRLLRKY